MRLKKSKNFSLATIALASFLLGLFGFTSPVKAAAAFNTFPISYTRETNKDLALIDARNVSVGGSTFSTSQADHDNGVQASAGEVIEFQIYYHNSGTAEDVATNVLVKATLPGGTRQSHEVSASIDSDQTSPVSSADLFRGGNITIHVSGQPQTLEFIPGSVRHFPNRSTTAQIPNLGDNVVGAGLNIGSVQGCWEFTGLVSFRARVGSVQETRGLNIDKRVLNVSKSETVFQNSTTASPGERVRFEIKVEITGNTGQNNVTLRDILPSQLTFVLGSFKQDGTTFTGDAGLFGSGINLGTLSPPQTRAFIIEATVAGAGVFSANTTLTNTANVRSDQVAVRQDDALVNVQLPSAAQFALRKTAFNLTKGVEATTVPADSGDIITYALYYKNTGQIQTPGVIIEDNIADIKELAEITNSGGATSVDGVIRFPPIDLPSGVEISRTFQVKVRDASLFPLTSDLVMVNVYGNEVRVQVRKPQVTGVVARPPRTGPRDWVPIAFASLVTIGYWFHRRRKAYSSI